MCAILFYAFTPAVAQLSQPNTPTIELLPDVSATKTEGQDTLSSELPATYDLGETNCPMSNISDWSQLSGPSQSTFTDIGNTARATIFSEGTYEFQQNCCTIDRKSSLLESLIGFGEATTGGLSSSGYTTVTTTNSDGPGSLREALKSNDPSWIIFDPSLDGQTIYLSETIDTSQPNKTIDGRGVDIKITAQGGSKGWPLFAFRGGNTIIHGIEILGGNSDVAAIMLREGSNYWVDHVTISDMGDDAISIGQGSKPSTSATDITISYYKVYNSPKGILTGGNGNFLTFPLTRVTIHSSDLAAGERNPRTQRGGQTHIFNSYLHSYVFVGMEAGRDGIIISENNVLSAKNARNSANSQTGRYSSFNFFAHESHEPVGHVFTTGDLYIDNAESSGSINPATPSKFRIPYTYPLIDSNAVIEHVTNNAGSQNNDSSFMSCKTYTRSVTVK